MNLLKSLRDKQINFNGCVVVSLNHLFEKITSNRNLTIRKCKIYKMNIQIINKFKRENETKYKNYEVLLWFHI